MATPREQIVINRGESHDVPWRWRASNGLGLTADGWANTRRGAYRESVRALRRMGDIGKA